MSSPTVPAAPVPDGRRRLAAPTIALAFALAGCPTPVQYGGLIPIDTSGFESRARMLCGAQLAAHAGEACVTSPKEAP